MIPISIQLAMVAPLTLVRPDALLADFYIEIRSVTPKQYTARWPRPRASHDPGTPMDQSEVVYRAVAFGVDKVFKKLSAFQSIA